MNLIVLIVLAVSLSMDAFSLSLAYGTLNISKNEIMLISLIVGLYHFFMPIIGTAVGRHFFEIIKINPNIISFIIFFIIGFQMIYNSFKNKNIKKLNRLDMLLFGLAVSLDSFSVGLTLYKISTSFILPGLIFSIFSSLFTYNGLLLGKKISYKIGVYSSVIGGVFLILIGILYII